MSSRSTVFCRLFLRSRSLSATPKHSSHPSVSSLPPPRPISASQITRSYSSSNFSPNSASRNFTPARRGSVADRAYDEISAQADIDRRQAKEEKRKAGIDVPEVDEDYVDPRPIIEKLQRLNAKYNPRGLNRFEEPSDSDSEPEDVESINMRQDIFQRQFDQYEKILDKFAKADSFDEAFKWMKRIDEFEEKHFKLRAEYRVIGELMNMLKVAEGKEKFLLQVKLNRALKLAEARDAFDPNDPANYGVIKREDAESYADRDEDCDMDEDDETKGDALIDLEFDDLKQKDNKFLEKINAIDKKLEEKLAELDYTFGRKGKLLEEEIRNLAEDRNSLIEKKRQPLYRKGFDVRMVDMNRTCKVTKGGQVVKYTALMACGNYNGVIGFAKAKALKVPLAIQKAREKCFQNLHYVERHEGHTVAHTVVALYKKTKFYIWPAPAQSGMKAGRTAQVILQLAGYKNVKSKVVGSRNPHNTVKAVFKALNAIETPKDVEEKFGRTVVESHLL